ncbi:hypothetical protein [Microcella alkaliphila]|uniref:Uncharacterized protein n=1 Tax=Microcella alkaliphila TaxID=279828 RepID=A0A0U5BBM6_9MICO|nr:hypothetical protein [Microcella alkaliphila]BAU32065.1 putative uncharacterized protein [Microcella alkaliphila]
MAVDSDDGANLRPVVPEGTRLAWSKGNPERRRALLFDTESGDLLGPPELVEVDEPEYDYSSSNEGEYSRPMTKEEREAAELVAAVAAIILIEVTKAAVAAVNEHVVPRVRLWWRVTAQPAIERAWERRPRRKRQPANGSTAEGGVAEIAAVANAARDIAPSVLAQQLEATFTEMKRAISPAEARQRHLAIELAEAFIAEQKRVLAESEVVEPFFENVQHAVEQLNTRQLPPGLTVTIDEPIEDEQADPSTIRLVDRDES